MDQFDISRLDITRQNIAVEKVLGSTQNPRHRYLLQSYLRHRYLESAGRWQEILDPALTADQAGKLLDPFIKPLPPFDESLLPA